MTISQEDGRVASGFVIVTLATAWGPRFGGINAFNTEIHERGIQCLGLVPLRGWVEDAAPYR